MISLIQAWPAEFIRFVGLRQYCWTTLHVRNSTQTWQVKFKIWAGNPRDVRIFMCEGYEEFIKDNNLKTGDKLLFNLLVDEGHEWQVYIFHRYRHTNPNASASTSAAPSSGI